MLVAQALTLNQRGRVRVKSAQCWKDEWKEIIGRHTTKLTHFELTEHIRLQFQCHWFHLELLHCCCCCYFHLNVYYYIFLHIFLMLLCELTNKLFVFLCFYRFI